jgi:hypothetical protein
MKKLLLIISFLTGYWTAFAQSASPTGSLQEPRWGHQSQLLNNGSILIFGGNNGYTGNRQRFATAEIYNPATKVWTITGRMNDKRDGFSSVLLHDGNVLAIGGQNQTQAILASCEIYDALTGIWRSAGNMSTPRMHHAAVKLQDGQVLVAGGMEGNKSEIYNPFENTWSKAGDMQLAHGAGLAMVLLDDGKVLATGGESYPTVAEIFDPITQTWSLLNNVTSRKHYFHAIVRLKNGNFLIVGTQSDDLKDQFSAEIYNPLTKAFTKTGDLVTNVREAPLVLLEDGKVLLYGLGDLYSPANTKCIQIYDPVNGIWLFSQYNFPGAQGASANKLSDGTILLAGGCQDAGNGATGTCLLVKQDNYAGCKAPAVTLAVYGNIVCSGNKPVISLPVTETAMRPILASCRLAARLRQMVVL